MNPMEKIRNFLTKLRQDKKDVKSIENVKEKIDSILTLFATVLQEYKNNKNGNQVTQDFKMEFEK